VPTVGVIAIDRHIARSVSEIVVAHGDVLHSAFDTDRLTADRDVPRSIIIDIAANGDIPDPPGRVIAVRAANRDVSRTAAAYRDVSHRPRHVCAVAATS
jgi:hypothetical protein